MLTKTAPALDTPLDPRVVAERYEQAAAEVANVLAHMDVTLTVAEAELAIVRYHQTHRQAHHAD